MALGLIGKRLGEASEEGTPPGMPTAATRTTAISTSGKFLGFRLNRKLQIGIAPKSIERLKAKVRELWRSRQSLTSNELRDRWRSFYSTEALDRVRRPTPVSRRRGSAEIVRFHLPEVPPIPQRDLSLTLAVTHKFPRRGSFPARMPNTGSLRNCS